MQSAGGGICWVGTERVRGGEEKYAMVTFRTAAEMAGCDRFCRQHAQHTDESEAGYFCIGNTLIFLEQ